MALPLSIPEAAQADRQLPDIDWSRVPSGTRSYFFDGPSGPLATWEMGDPGGERVVLVPGATGSKEDFTWLMSLLAGAGYFVQSYDIAGQYQSADAGPLDPSDRDAWDYNLFYNDLVAFLSQGKPAHLLGFSFSGIVSELVLARQPQLVRSLTLLATPPAVGQVFRHVRILGWISRLPIFTARRGGGVLLWNVRTNFSKVTPERLRFANARLELTRRESVDGIVALMMRTPDVRGALRDSGIPLLVAAGTHDLWRPKLYREFARRTGGEVAIFDTGHSPCETTPNQLAVRMLQTFDRAVKGVQDE